MVKPSFRYSCLKVLLYSCIGIAVSLSFWLSGLLDEFELAMYNLRAVYGAAPAETTGSIVLVVVDQESLDWVAENMSVVWPWPRELYAAVIDNSRRRGAKAIGFDVLFTEASSYGVSDDLALQNSIGEAGNFALGSVFPTNRQNGHAQWPADIPRPAWRADADQGKVSLPDYLHAVLPIAEIGSTAAVLCNVQQSPDKGGIYRRINPFVTFDNVLIPTMGIGVYLAAHPDAELVFNRQQLAINGLNIPLDKQGAAIMRFRGPSRTFATVSAASFIRQEFQLQNGEIAEEQVALDLQNKYVLFGFVAPGLFDLRPAPTDGIFAGVEINATVLDNLLNSDFIRPTTPGWTTMFIISFTVFAALAVFAITSLQRQIAAAAGILLLPLAAATALYAAGYDFKLVPVQLAGTVAVAAAIIHGYFGVLGRERFIRHSFRHYLSPVVIDQLISNPDRLRLGGERKPLSLFFSDLQGFTTISEGLEPEQLTHLLNSYLTAMTDIILDEQGTVDKFEGDAIIAFWNAPLDVPDHAVRAVRAALRCQQELDRLRPQFKEQYGKDLYMRIGINTGQAVVGNMGSSSRFDYTVLGDAVNLAARLEGANKNFGTYTMISQATFSELDDSFICRELGRLRVVGRREAVTVYQPLSYGGKPAVDCSSFQQGLLLFYQGEFNTARQEFEKTAGSDPAAGYYLRQCRYLLQHPPYQWQGICELGAK